MSTNLIIGSVILGIAIIIMVVVLVKSHRSKKVPQEGTGQVIDGGIDAESTDNQVGEY